MRQLVNAYMRVGLVPLILIALVLGVLIGSVAKDVGMSLGVLGDVFVGALKAVAPILVFALVLSAVAGFKSSSDARVKPVMLLYVVGTFTAALTAVLASFAFPIELVGLADMQAVEQSAPQSLREVLKNLLMNLVANPVTALSNANYLGILTWSVLIGLGLRHAASETTKTVVHDISNAVSAVVKWIVAIAPFGILGLVSKTVAETGFDGLASYAKLLIVLVGAMLFIALVVNPLIVLVKTRKNPYPLVIACLRESGVTAFFTRSSAANIPVNMNLAKKLGLNEDTYSLTIPLGATINMAGAAITINILTLAAAHTLGVEVSFFQALLLAIVGSVSACGASGVAGGSLLLIPLACGLFNISNDIAMQVVAIGFIIGVVQDSAETALNSSTDVLFTAAADPKYAYKS